MRALLFLVAALALAACAGVGERAPAPTAVPTPTFAARGKVLFVNKGCITCHPHSRVEYTGHTIEVGPDLSSYHGETAFLTAWLRSPAAVRPGTAMPTLGLGEAEIAALIAFINE